MTHKILNWPSHQQLLSESGFVLLPPALSADECHELANLFDKPDLYRKTIVMQKHGYGSGEYKYFNYPLPPIIDTLRHELFTQIAPVTNDWNEKLGLAQRYPTDLDEWLASCHQAGQKRPTALILKYGSGDWNALHQDIYGELYFPFQAVLFLNQPGQDFSGGEFVLMEQRPRMQSKAIVLQPEQGQILIFTTKFRPQKGTRGYHRIGLRHGVSEVKTGRRMTVGLIFHDAA
ncbi:prolyl 4-hydroxylase subunit alpha [Spirosoma sp. HMF4905]|uniref:Prolyl 4-hydroxylase subunit alpha n=1 Tax=Spirosoma arboris TaxID=2682092 RepID=A0A7K1SCC9_9BACT|nr:2OG-Fe(II) oxygenase [Spirosoma arboris]MVM31440.1 prolyl 4-hydroxylase subunit alpha [Spirosoma arboris]